MHPVLIKKDEGEKGRDLTLRVSRVMVFKKITAGRRVREDVAEKAHLSHP